MNTIIINGCSMASGFECTVPGQQSIQDKNYAWPAHLCNILKSSGYNLSQPGQSNFRIAVNTLSFLMQHLNEFDNKLLVIIGWTEFTRSEFINNEDIFHFNAGFADWVKNGKLTLREDTPEVNNAYKTWAAQSLDNHMSRFAWTYVMLKSFLNLHNIPYFFFNSITSPIMPSRDLLLYNDLESNGIKTIWESILHDPFYYQEITQYNWLSENYPNHKIGTGDGQYHWNSTALQAWAEVISSKLPVTRHS